MAACAGPSAAGPVADAPLFRGDRPLSVTLEAELDSIRAERFATGEPVPRAGTLRYRGPAGRDRTLAVRVRRRGESRRHICDFPPLLVELVDGGGDDPVFGGLDVLYHVSHCRDHRPGFDALVIREYLAYRLVQELAPEALRARLLRVRYRTPDGVDDAGDRWAFAVEDRARLSERAGGRWVEGPVDLDRMDGERAMLVSVFQYLIGNTDWGLATGHNVMNLETPEGRIVPVPFDFDFSGLVDAPYARPDPRWGLESVRERAFLGACRHLPSLGPALERVRGARARLLDEVRSVPGLAPEEREATAAYLEEGLEVLDEPARVDAELREACRTW